MAVGRRGDLEAVFDDAAPLIDPFGRSIRYVRLSVTDRCDLRCVYCMPARMRFASRPEVLTDDELEAVARAFVALGTRRMRITGGEPLVRRDVMALFGRLGGLVGAGLDELTVTTNGSRLVECAEGLFAAGVRRVNVSLDTLDPARFAAVTRGGVLARTMDGIVAALAAGLAVRVNAVALRGINEDGFDRLIGWCGELGVDLALIETMPLGEVEEDRTDRYLPLSEVRRELSTRWTLVESAYRTGGPARFVTVAETGGRLGFITPMTHEFCGSCNRVRVSCTGMLHLCLGQEEGADLRAVLREGPGEAGLADAIRAAVRRKPRGHDFVIGGTTIARHMSVTGG